MARMHIHISVDDLEKSTDFYSKLFGKKPTKQKRTMQNGCLMTPELILQYPRAARRPD